MKYDEVLREFTTDLMAVGVPACPSQRVPVERTVRAVLERRIRRGRLVAPGDQGRRPGHTARNEISQRIGRRDDPRAEEDRVPDGAVPELPVRADDSLARKYIVYSTAAVWGVEVSVIVQDPAARSPNSTLYIHV